MPEQTSEEIQAKQQESIVFKENINQLPIDNDVASEEVPQGEFTFVKAWTRDEVRATRTVKGNAYQYIPLELMHKLVTHPKMKAVQFNNEEGVPLLQKSFAEVLQDPVLKTFRDYVIEQGIAQFITEPEAVFSFENAGLTQQEVQYLYHEYIHNQLRPVPDELQDKSGVVEYYFGDWGGYLTNGSRSYNKEKTVIRPRELWC